LQGWGHPYAAFGGAFVQGGFAIVFEEIVVVAAIFSLLIELRARARRSGRRRDRAHALERERRDVDGGCREPADDLPRPRTALARALLPVRDRAARRRARSRRSSI
jgi:hypothetical protein